MWLMYTPVPRGGEEQAGDRWRWRYRWITHTGCRLCAVQKIRKFRKSLEIPRAIPGMPKANLTNATRRTARPRNPVVYPESPPPEPEPCATPPEDVEVTAELAVTRKELENSPVYAPSHSCRTRAESGPVCRAKDEAGVGAAQAGSGIKV